MSSGFIPGGTIDKPTERDDEWLEAQKDIEAARRRKEEEGRQEGGKTLYEVLQANKAAKQEAFEESIRLKNQFRNLDEDEIEFLDSVLESTREKEEAVKKETAQQLDLFRRQQEEADKALLNQSDDVDDVNRSNATGSPQSEESQWAINARKRKRGREKEVLKGVKLRKSSLGETLTAANGEGVVENPPAQIKDKDVHSDKPATKTKNLEITNPSPTTIASPEKSTTKSPTVEKESANLGLSGYSSDED